MKSSILFWVFWLSWLSSFGQNGALDLSYGINGEVHLDLDALDDLEGLLIDESGNTFFYGQSSEDLGGIYPFDFVFGKLMSDGSLDPSFGNSGIYRSDFPGNNISSLSHAVWDTSGIYFIGTGSSHGVQDTNGFFIGKLKLTGEIDSSFADNGFYTNNFMGSFNTSGGLILDSEQRLVFSGSTNDQLNTNLEFPIIGRLTKDGFADSTFGSTGIVVWDYFDGVVVDLLRLRDHPERHGEGGYFTEIIEVNEAYFCAGFFENSSFTQMYTAKINKQGGLSSNFLAPIPYHYQIEPGVNHFVEDLVLEDDHIYISFHTFGATYGNSFGIEKVDTAGLPIETYSIVHTDYTSQITGLEFYHGKPYFTGYTVELSNVAPGHQSDDFILFSADSTFNPIASFGQNGAVSHHFAFDLEQGSEDLIFNQDKIILGGYVNNVMSSNYTDFAFLAMTADSTNSIIEKSTQNITLFPNPSNNYFQIDGLANQEWKCQIFDLRGKIVSESSFDSDDEWIDVSSLQTGIYIIKGVSINDTFEITFSVVH